MSQPSRAPVVFTAILTLAAIAAAAWWMTTRLGPAHPPADPGAAQDSGNGNINKNASRTTAADALARHRILASVHFVNSRLEEPKHREEVVRAVEEADECVRLAPDSPVDQLNYAICILRQYDERRFENNNTDTQPAVATDWVEQAKPLLAKAEGLLESVRRARPDLAIAHFHAAMTAVRRGKLEASDDNSTWKIKFREAAEQYLKIEDRSAAIRYHLGFLDFKDSKYKESEASLRRAVALDPNHPNAYYSLGLAIARQGDSNKKPEVDRAFATHRDLQESIGKARAQWDPDAVYDATYPELVPVAPAAVAPEVAGATRLVPLDNAPTLQFATPMLRGDSTLLEGGLSHAGDRAEFARGAMLAFHADGRNSFINITNGALATPQETAPGALERPVTAAVAADFDGDHFMDLAAVDGARILWLRGTGHKAADGYKKAVFKGLEAPIENITDIFAADLDADGDLDLVVSQTLQNNAILHIFRNDALPDPAPDSTPPENMTFTPNFTDVGAVPALRVESAGAARRVIPLDFDRGNDTDILFINVHQSALFANRRGLVFEKIADLPGAEDGAAGDLDGDGFTDVVLANREGVALVKSARDRMAEPKILLKMAMESPRVALVDIENRGQLDIVVFAKDRAVVLRAAGGDQYINITDNLIAAPFQGEPLSIAAADLDGDFDLDLVVARRGAPAVVYYNKGSERNPGIAAVFRGTKTNRAGIGGKLEARAGGLRVFREVWSVPTILAVGPRSRIDGLFIKWTNGIDEAEGAVPLGRFRGFVEKRGREGSCPFVYSWDGEKFIFITDALGATPLGLYAAPGIYVPPQDREWLRITSDQLKPRNGKYEIRFTEEMRELTYLDRVRLLCVDHPEGTTVYPDERFCFPPFPAKQTLRITGEIPVRTARDSSGADVTDLLLKEDRKFTHPPRRIGYQGMCEDHFIEIDLGEIKDYQNLRLFLTGWFAWTNSSINRAIAFAGIRFTPPRIEVLSNGAWRVAVEDAGFPAGMQKTMCVDLKNKLKAGEQVIRIITNIALYWDRAFISYNADDAADSARPFATKTTEIAASKAELRWRGISRWSRPGGVWPSEPVYADFTAEPVYDLHVGDYTKYGDVLELLTNDDDRFVIFHHGDEVALEFDAPPPPAPGMTRTFYLDSSGWAKDMDPNTFAPQSVGPLPFHGMSGYPYTEKEHYPADAAHELYQRTWNTRSVRDARPLPIRAGIEAIHKD